MRRAAVLGKGALAAHACETIAALPETVLDTVIPNASEPEWDIRLSDYVSKRWPEVRILRSGDWRELEPGRCDLVFSVLYDKIIGPGLIDNTERIINCHPGRLPQYRGARPVNWALHNRENLHGITIHVIDSGIDSGPVLTEALFSIWPDIDEVEDVWQRSMEHGRLLISDTLPRLDRIVPRPQDTSAAVTHYSRDSTALGNRSDWTRVISADPV
ncbi:formyltransferase family protein [Kitasatospora sp. GP82]|uniref:formyltransferase family protein n=1 Tax=Kitasatospora sp. GP82 TaxID=3035089 RepID=UPI0024765B1F|nr:formyltransferase family protein [Kitasatospora sp. GP82]MDH6129735.1 methionyl-tRNA formyltransferase [Kitasatospora sp. GP82]